MKNNKTLWVSELEKKQFSLMVRESSLWRSIIKTENWKISRRKQVSVEELFEKDKKPKTQKNFCGPWETSRNC